MDRGFRGMIRRNMSLTQARILSKDLTSSKIRRTFLDYFCEEKKHMFVRSSPVFSLLDPTLAFVNAGMTQFKDVFMGLAHPPAPRVANSQKCVRIQGKQNDFSQVGTDGSHHTFFEMLGNWSFGDYSKEEACGMSWDLLTNVYGIPPRRLYVTYYSGNEALDFEPDREVREIWRQIGVQENRILPFGMKENFWECGVTGPCGPCTEIHYDTEPHRENAAHLVNRDNSGVIELWNLVFTQYHRKSDGTFENLRKHFVDTGMGFERLVAVLQDKPTNYDTDLFLPLFEAISRHTNHSGYTGQYFQNFDDYSYRVIADHSRMLAVALADGMMPKRQVRVRMVLKRALHLAEKVFGADQALLKELISHVADMFSDAYPEVGRNLAKIHHMIDGEVELMREKRSAALERWNQITKKYHSLADLKIHETPQLLDGMDYVQENILKQGKFLLTGEDIWVLFDRFGVPPIISEQLAFRLGLKCDMGSFEKKKSSMKEENRKSQDEQLFSMRQETRYLSVLAKLEEKQVQPTFDYFKYDYRVGPTGEYIFHEQPTTVEAIVRNNELLEEISVADVQGEKIGLVLDRTQFFTKEGSQVDDVGTLQIEKEIFFDVERLTKIKDFVIHFGKFRSGPSDAKVSVRDIGVLRLDEGRRVKIMRNHTALHLVNAAVREMVPNVLEKSSVAQPDNLRLVLLINDGSLRAPDDLKKIEDSVREMISQSVSVKKMVMTCPEFHALEDVVYVPGENVARPELAVVEISSGFRLSREYCTGTHVHNTADIKDFVITKFWKGSYGTPIIEAVTGEKCLEFRRRHEEMLKEWEGLLLEKESCDELKKVLDLRNKIKQFRSNVQNGKDISYIFKFNFEADIKTELDKLQSLKRDLIAKEIQMAEANAESFTVYCYEKDSDFRMFDLDNLMDLVRKPLVMILKQNDLAAIRCYVPKTFVSEGFSAEKWLLETIMPFGGTGYHLTSGDPDLLYISEERKFTEKQLDQALEIAARFVRKNLKS